MQRGRFAADILKAVRAEVGPDYPVIIRLSQWKQQDYAVQMARTPQEMEAWLLTVPEPPSRAYSCQRVKRQTNSTAARNCAGLLYR